MTVGGAVKADTRLAISVSWYGTFLFTKGNSRSIDKL